MSAAAAGTTTESSSGLTAMSFIGMTVNDVPAGQFVGYAAAMSAREVAAIVLACATDAPGASRAFMNAE